MKNRLLAAATIAIGSGCGTFTEAEFGGDSGAATSTATAAEDGDDAADGAESAGGGSESAGGGSAEAGSSGGVDGTQGTGGDATGGDATGGDATGGDATGGDATGESTDTAAESSSDGAASTGGELEDWDACFALLDMAACELAPQCEWSNSECEPAVGQETYCESFDTEVSCAASLWECTWEKGACDDPG